MRKLQRILLMAYAICVFILSFIYVPYYSQWQGNRTFLGHHLRARFRNMLDMEWPYQVKDQSGNFIYVSVDAVLIIAEVIALTVIVAAVYISITRKSTSLHHTD